MKKKKPRPALDADKEAIRWFKRRVPIRKEEWLALDVKTRKRAFTVARVSQLNVINDTLKAITKAIEKGETLEQFKARTKGRFEEWHAEVIFRNNLQAAYAHGREAQLREPEALEQRPFWMYSSVLDSRTTEVCRRIHGTVLPASSKWWHTHTPPLHHQCRGIKRALTPEQAAKLGVAKRGPRVPAQEGFGHADPLEWEPDLSGYPSVLVREYKRKR